MRGAVSDDRPYRDLEFLEFPGTGIPPFGGPPYAVAPDRKRFLVSVPVESAAQPLEVILQLAGAAEEVSGDTIDRPGFEYDHTIGMK